MISTAVIVAMSVRCIDLLDSHSVPLSVALTHVIQDCNVPSHHLLLVKLDLALEQSLVTPVRTFLMCYVVILLAKLRCNGDDFAEFLGMRFIVAHYG